MESEGLALVDDDGHAAVGVAEVPRKEVHIGIHMAGGAGARSVAGELGVIQEATAIDNDRGRGIKGTDGNLAEQRVIGRIDYGNGVRDTVQHVEDLCAREEREAARTALCCRVDLGSRSGTDL